MFENAYFGWRKKRISTGMKKVYGNLGRIRKGQISDLMLIMPKERDVYSKT